MSHGPAFSFVLEHASAAPSSAEAHFLSKLAVETDPADLVADLERGAPGITVVDVRSPEDFARCHVPTAINIPTRRIGPETTAHVPTETLIVTYCWGPGCNGSTKAAVRFAALGFRVKELIGGLEYWRKEGCPVEGAEGAQAPLYWRFQPAEAAAFQENAAPSSVGVHP